MKEEARVLVLRAQGTNCDAESMYAANDLGALAEVVHLNRIIRGKVSLEGYHCLILPGGFSFGDRVRSGAILGKVLSHTLGKELENFVEEGKPVLGICNGFQVLLEAEILPGNGEKLALGENLSARFEDRWCHLRREGESLFTPGVGRVIGLPVANGEGRLIFPQGREREVLERLEEKGQIAFRYSKAQGELAGGSYPHNPSGSYADIAGITNEEGNVLGLMPHPERAYYTYMYPSWTRRGMEGGEGYGEGYTVFKNMLDYVKGRF